MLCTSCRNKSHCLPAQLAQGDAALDQLLRQLKRCSLRPRRTLWQRATGFCQSLWGRLQMTLSR
ncbi:MAG: hypothetical protein WBA99_09330 [Nodosilinea sp.]